MTQLLWDRRLPGFQSSLGLPRFCLLVSPKNGSFPLCTAPATSLLYSSNSSWWKLNVIGWGELDRRCSYFKNTSVFLKEEVDRDWKPVQSRLVLLSKFNSQGLRKGNHLSPLPDHWEYYGAAGFSFTSNEVSSGTFLILGGLHRGATWRK